MGERLELASFPNSFYPFSMASGSSSAPRLCASCTEPIPFSSPTTLCPRCARARSDAPTETDLSGTASHPIRSSPLNSPFSAPPLKSSFAAIPGFELSEEIARGGMGIVFKARQVSLNRTVALKMILSGAFATPEAVERFRVEAEAAANLQHPNIVTIHEVGEFDGCHYHVMDYVDGPNLAEWLHSTSLSSSVPDLQSQISNLKAPLPPRSAATLLKELADAIHYAHTRGILHRDLKPQNILIDSAGRPRITDFGLAKRLADDSDLTLTGQVLGSPGYLAPEQATGRKDQLGPPTDVYALGAILYFLLTGRPPFSAATPIETVRLSLETDPAPPSRLNPHTTVDLETICLKCLAKTPPERYPSARALAEDLERFLKKEPVLARPVSVIGKFWRAARRHPWILTGTVSLFCLGLIGLAYGLWQETLLLRWKLDHPGALLPKKTYVADSSATGGVVLYICLLIGILPLEDLRRRRNERQPLSWSQFAGFIAFALFETAGALWLFLQWTSAYVWNSLPLWRWPGLACLPALCLFWFGAVLIWKTACPSDPQLRSRISNVQSEIPNRSRLIVLWLVFVFLAVWWLSELLNQEIYWRFTFFFCAVSSASLLISISLFRVMHRDVRPFCLFLILTSAVFSIELFSRPTNLDVFRATLVGIAAGLFLIRVLRVKRDE